MEKIQNLKECLTMMEIIVFAIALVVAQTAAGLITMKIFMSKKYIKKVAKMSLEISQELTEELDI